MHYVIIRHIIMADGHHGWERNKAEICRNLSRIWERECDMPPGRLNMLIRQREWIICATLTGASRTVWLMWDIKVGYGVSVERSEQIDTITRHVNVQIPVYTLYILANAQINFLGENQTSCLYWTAYSTTESEWNHEQRKATWNVSAVNITR